MKFQSYNSLITTISVMPKIAIRFIFQSYNSLITTKYATEMFVGILRFQSYNSLITTIICMQALIKSDKNFNPTIVLLQLI